MVEHEKADFLTTFINFVKVNYKIPLLLIRHNNFAFAPNNFQFRQKILKK